MTEAVKHLEAAKELISDPSKWIRFNFAQDSEGRIVEATDRSACKWCLLGAVNKTEESIYTYGSVYGFLEAAAKDFGYSWTRVDLKGIGNPPLLNDETDHPTVMKMFSLAIRYAKGEVS